MQDLALRRAAVLVAGLDVADADALLAQLPEAAADAIRAAVMELDDVAWEEESEVVAEFLSGAGANLGAGAGAATVEPTVDDLELSSDAMDLFQEEPEMPPESHSPRDATADPWREHRFAWAVSVLEEAAPAELAALLAEEHPQAAAVVLGALDRDQAERVLGSVPGRLQEEWMRRLSALEALDQEAAAEVVIAAASQLGPGREEHRRRTTSQPGRTETKPAPKTSVGEAYRSPRAAGRALALTWTWEDLESATSGEIAAATFGENEAVIALALLGATSNGCRTVLASLAATTASRVQRRMRRIKTFSLADVRRAQQRLLANATAAVAQGRMPPPQREHVSLAA